MIRSILASLPLVVVLGCGDVDRGSSPSTSEPAPRAEVPASVREETESPADGTLYDAGSCTSYSVPPTSGCTYDDILFSQAKQACEAEGTVLNSFTGAQDCFSGSSTQYSYTCCAAKPHCKKHTPLYESKCYLDRSFFTIVEEECLPSTSVAKFAVTRGSCPAGKSVEAEYTCSCL